MDDMSYGQCGGTANKSYGRLGVWPLQLEIL